MLNLINKKIENRWWSSDWKRK